MKLALAIAALALVLVSLAGCGEAPVTHTTPPMEGGKYVIHLTAGSLFMPADAAVPANATVVFVNDGGVHDVTEGEADGAHAWSSDDTLGHKMNEGDRFEHTFAAPGVVHYVCKIHASTGMKGTLTVG